MMIPKLTVKNQDNFFGTKVKHLEYFTYTAAFLYGDVLAFADKAGYHIEYCDHTTVQYRALKREESWEVKVTQTRLAAIEEPEATEPTTPSLPEQWIEFRNKVGDLVLRFEADKNEAARIRDRLRDTAEEISSIVESFDDGVEGMDEALRTFRHALDDMSQYV